MPVASRTPWLLLRQVRRFTVRVATCNEGGLQQIHTGAGELAVHEAPAPDSSTIVWSESGRWTAGPLAGTRFRNAMLWEQCPDRPGIRLSHLRRGRDRATFLVHLEPRGPLTWTAADPHQCGHDRYFAALEWDSRRLKLIWEVQSPTDPYRLTLEATTAGD